MLLRMGPTPLFEVPLRGTLRVPLSSIEGLVPPPPSPHTKGSPLKVPFKVPLEGTLQVFSKLPLRYKGTLQGLVQGTLKMPLKVPLKVHLKVPVWTCVKYVPKQYTFRSTLNTGYITGLDMCALCTEAVHSVAL